MSTDLPSSPLCLHEKSNKYDDAGWHSPVRVTIRPGRKCFSNDQFIFEEKVDSNANQKRKFLSCLVVLVSIVIVLLVVMLWIIHSMKVVMSHDPTETLTTTPDYTTSISTESASMEILSTEPFSFTSTATTTVPRERIRKVLFLVADGIPADVIETVSVTHLKSIQTQGAYTRAYVGGQKGAYTQTATISSPGYMSLLTGTWAHKHNVYNNYVKNPNYHYKNIFRLVKEQRPDKTIGIFSTWTTNRLRLIGEGLFEAGNITFDYAFDRYELDRRTYPHDKQSVYIFHIDERVTNETAQCIRTHAPDLSWVYLQFTDDVGHFHGDSERFHQAILYLDDQIGRIWKAIDYRTRYHHEDWLLLITTDHGRDAKTGKHHAGQSVRERTTWIISNEPTMNNYFHQRQPAIVDLFPTISRFLNITIPVDSARELDGIPLVGKVSLLHPIVYIYGEKLRVSWTVLDPTGHVTIWLATSNQFKKGLADNYTLIDTVPIHRKKLTFDLRPFPSQFYKVVLEGQYNTVNRWAHRTWYRMVTNTQANLSGTRNDSKGKPSVR